MQGHAFHSICKSVFQLDGNIQVGETPNLAIYEFKMNRKLTSAQCNEYICLAFHFSCHIYGGKFVAFISYCIFIFCIVYFDLAHTKANATWSIRL